MPWTRLRRIILLNGSRKWRPSQDIVIICSPSATQMIKENCRSSSQEMLSYIISWSLCHICQDLSTCIRFLSLNPAQPLASFPSISSTHYHDQCTLFWFRMALYLESRRSLILLAVLCSWRISSTIFSAWILTSFYSNLPVLSCLCFLANLNYMLKHFKFSLHLTSISVSSCYISLRFISLT
jgi:hypothetical protein